LGTSPDRAERSNRLDFDVDITAVTGARTGGAGEGRRKSPPKIQAHRRPASASATTTGSVPIRTKTRTSTRKQQPVPSKSLHHYHDENDSRNATTLLDDSTLSHHEEGLKDHDAHHHLRGHHGHHHLVPGTSLIRTKQSIAVLPGQRTTAIPTGGRGMAHTTSTTTTRQTDRVARWQQLNQAWSNSSFLSRNAATGSRFGVGRTPTGLPSTTTQARKRGEEPKQQQQQQQQQQRQRPKTAQERLSAVLERSAMEATSRQHHHHHRSQRPVYKPNNYLPPQEKRRDELRWAVRREMLGLGGDMSALWYKA